MAARVQEIQWNNLKIISKISLLRMEEGIENLTGYTKEYDDGDLDFEKNITMYVGKLFKKWEDFWKIPETRVQIVVTMNMLHIVKKVKCTRLITFALLTQVRSRKIYFDDSRWFHQPYYSWSRKRLARRELQRLCQYADDITLCKGLRVTSLTSVTLKANWHKENVLLSASV